jgi:23S rRNA (guanosine2251-2'-O)-methyltransferase
LAKRSGDKGVTEHLYGRRPVLEALRASRRECLALLIAENTKETEIIHDLMRAAEARQVPVRHVPRAMLNDLARTTEHQGVVLKAGPFSYVEDVEDILALAEQRGEPPFMLILDLLQDPQNVGALLRVAEAVGVHGVLIQERRAVAVTPAVVSASSGAVEHLQIVMAKNLVNAMKKLKEANVWLVGMEAAPEAKPIDQVDMRGAIGLVLGSEGEGMRRLVIETCDFTVQLPMRGQIASLNVATAGAVGLYVIWGARGWQGWPAAQQM